MNWGVSPHHMSRLAMMGNVHPPQNFTQKGVKDYSRK